MIDYSFANNKYWASTADEWIKIWISDNDNKYHIFEIQYIAAKNMGFEPDGMSQEQMKEMSVAFNLPK